MVPYSQASSVPIILSALRKNWKIPVYATLLAGGVAAVLNFFILPAQYGASALVYILPNRIELSFESKIRNLPAEIQEAGSRKRTMEALAASPEIAVKVLQSVRGQLHPKEQNALLLMECMDLVVTGEFLRVSAYTRDPKLSVDVANAWAEGVRDMAAASFSGRGAVTERDCTEALANYKKVQADLVQFSSQADKTMSLEFQSRGKQAELERRQGALVRLEKAIQDVQSLISDAKASREGGEVLDFGSRLSAVLVRISTLESAAAAKVPINLTLPSGDLGSGTKADPLPPSSVHSLERLIAQLRADEAILRKSILESPIPEELLKIQGQIESMHATRRELTGIRDVAWDAYMTLFRKSQETRVLANPNVDTFKVVSQGFPDPRPVRPRRLLNIAIATAVGCLLGILGACLGSARVLLYGETVVPTRARGEIPVHSGAQ